MIGHLLLKLELERPTFILGMLSNQIYDITRQKYLLQHILQRRIADHGQNLMLLSN
jgi:hypothetical protein